MAYIGCLFSTVKTGCYTLYVIEELASLVVSDVAVSTSYSLPRTPNPPLVINGSDGYTPRTFNHS